MGVYRLPCNTFHVTRGNLKPAFEKNEYIQIRWEEEMNQRLTTDKIPLPIIIIILYTQTISNRVITRRKKNSCMYLD